MNLRHANVLTFFFGLLISTAVSVADVSLAGIFSDNMVLQRDRAVPVWGWAAPGEKISVHFGGQTVATHADAGGNWLVRLAPMPANAQPQELTVAASNTQNRKNILVGDVWLCSGQSNMAFGLGGCNAEEDIHNAHLPLIRCTYVEENFAAAPQRDIAPAHWRALSPETAAGYSGVAFYFARKVQQEVHVPLGMLLSTIGGTEIECWMSPEALAYPENASAAKRYHDAIEEWQKELGTMRVVQGKPVGLELGQRWAAEVRAALLSSNTAPSPSFIALEAWMNDAHAALRGGSAVSTPPNFEPVESWLRKLPIRDDLKRIPVAPHPLTDRHGVGGHGWFRTQSLYNGMIHPLIPFAFKGMLWYQGENGSDHYYNRMHALVETMRKEWRDDFPFYYVQIASWNKPPATPQTEQLAFPLTRMAQLQALDIPKSGMAVTIDIGDEKDLHPKNKRDAGERLALWALANDYGQKNLVCSGPLYKSIAVEANKIRVRFTSVGGGLMVGKKVGFGPAIRDQGGKLAQFAIAGDDKIWHWADAVIDGDTVVVSSSEVSRPVAVRYAFATNPQGCNLYNREGLPASPFRSDNWPAW